MSLSSQVVHRKSKKLNYQALSGLDTDDGYHFEVQEGDY